ncbi:molybdenum cofactor guanylyltransferase [Paenibacillus apiarius]|uniref:molybdenum cofactor guanylyltransferase n=1 Tax=Paenibacillus apiarius TaxID=46240 RepID=UPI003B3A056C
MDTVGIVLAGGLSKRFGSPKAFAQSNGRFYYEVAYEALRSISSHVVVVGRPEFQERFLPKMNVITDAEQFMGCGPLAGIYSAMAAYPAKRYVILPCDMPYMTADVMKSLVKCYAGEDAAAVEADGARHPLVAVFHRRMKDFIHRSLAQGQYSVMRLLAQVDVRWVQGSKLTVDSGHVFQNRNTPE